MFLRWIEQFGATIRSQYIIDYIVAIVTQAGIGLPALPNNGPPGFFRSRLHDIKELILIVGAVLFLHRCYGVQRVRCPKPHLFWPCVRLPRFVLDRPRVKPAVVPFKSPTDMAQSTCSRSPDENNCASCRGGKIVGYLQHAFWGLGSRSGVDSRCKAQKQASYKQVEAIAQGVE